MHWGVLALRSVLLTMLGLVVSGDADDEHTVHIAWRATDPGTWGMGPNAFHAQLVVILNDGDGTPSSQSLSLGTRRATFDDVRIGTKPDLIMAFGYLPPPSGAR